MTEHAARWPRAKLVLSLALLVAGLALPPGLIQAQTAPRPSVAETLPAAASAHFRAARELLGQHTPKLAEAEIRAGLKLAPRSSEGLTLLGAALVEQKDLAGAEEAFQRALKINPQSAEAHNSLGNIYYAQKKLDLAEKEFQATLRYYPRDRDGNYNLGLLLLARNDPRGAINYFSRVQPQSPEVLFNLTQAYFATGQKEKGLELARTLSEQAKNDVRTHFTLGLLLAKQRQYTAASHEFEIANSLQPDTFEILYNLGQAYLKKGDKEKAVDVLGQALKLSPNSVETLYLIAQTHADEGKDLDALELLVKAHKLAPANANVIFLMARLSMKQSFFEDAIPLLEDGLKAVPNRPDLLAALGESYFMAGKVDKAKDAFQTLIQVNPSARSYAFMALCYRNQGRFDEAVKFLEQGLKADPHDVSCLYNMGYIASRQGQYDQGEKWLTQALSVDPNYAEALLELANLKMHQKKYSEAVPLLRKCIQLQPHPAPVYYRLQAAERDLHQTEAADRDLKIFQTLSRDPTPLPSPFQDIFAYLDHRGTLTPQQQTQVDIEQLDREAKDHPDRPQNFYFLAEAYLKLGRVEDAKRAVAQLDQLSQGDFRTMMGAGVLLARYHQYPGAIAHFQQALQANPDSDDAWYDLADAFFRGGDYADALTYVQHVSKQGQKDPSYLALTADILAHLGQSDEAVKLLGQEIAANPDQDQAYLSLALVYLRSSDTSSARGALQRGLERTPDSGSLLWGMGVVSAMEGDIPKAEQQLKESVDLLPGWPGSFSALGVLYYQTGQIDKARETLERFKQSGPHGALNVQGIEQTLSAAGPESLSGGKVHDMTPQARQQFLQIALALADQSP
ncbi:MAG: tetratricopeptide repeat protein [Terriglobia bacterium]